MKYLKPPHLEDQPPTILPKATLRALIRACRGRDFQAIRDRAIIRILIDTGLRRQELASITLDNLDLDGQRVKVLGKGRRFRWLHLNLKSIDAIKHYMKRRERYPNSQSNYLWLGKRGPITGNGIYQIIKRRANKAGVANVYPHLFRHTWVHNWLAEGGNERDAMILAGWKTRTMIDHYGRSAEVERAHAAHKRLAIGERI
jgi:site-specific recombinase XerD